MELNPVRIEELLAHAGWVKKLAVRLVRDAGTADDVSQEVWAHALRSPPRDRTNLRAWLSVAVRNSVRSLNRAEVRRADREAVVEVRHEEPPTSEIVERAQLHRHLVEQVLALEEPQRSIVLAYWFEDQSLAEIARRQHMTERVAKTRLDAGHALLRQRMDKSSGGRAAWCLAYTKWLGPSLAPAGAGTALTVGGLFVASKLVIVSAVVVAAAVGWYVWPALETQPSVASASRAPEILVPEPINESKELVEAHTSSAREPLALAAQSNPVTAAAATETRWVVRGHVRGAPVGRETETKLIASCLGAFHIPKTAVAVVQRDGSFEIDLTDVIKSWLNNGLPSEVQVVAEHPQCLSVQTIMPFKSARIDNTSAALCHEFRCDFQLETAASVTGRVVMPPDWKPEPGRLNLLGADERPRARVSLFDLAKSTLSNEGIDHAQCDGDGKWLLRSSRSGTFTVIAHLEGLRPTAIVVSLALGQAVHVGAVALEHGASISGTVRRNGQPIGAGARIVANMKSKSPPRISFPSQGGGATYLHASSNGFEWTQARAFTRSDGTYSFAGLAPAEFELRVESAPRCRGGVGGRQITERTVLAPQSGVDLEGVPPTIELALKVDGRAPTNADLEGVVVVIAGLSDGSGSNDFKLTGSAQGYGKIQLVPGAAYELRVPPGRYAPKVVAIGALEAGDERMLPLDLVTQDSTGTLVVRFVTDEPQNLVAAQFAFQDLADASGTSLDWRREKRSRSGEFVVRNSPSGNWRVHVRPFDSVGIGMSDHLIATELDVSVPAKGTVEREVRLEVGGRLRVSAKNELGGFVRTPVELRNARNEKMPTHFYCRTPDTGAAGCGWYLCEIGINDHPPLPAGHYELTLSAPDFAKQVVPFDLVRGETKTLEVVLRPR